MKKTKIMMGTLSVILAIVGGFGYYKNQVPDNSLLVINIEALSQQDITTKNTGPAKMYDCPGLGTGDGKMCMCSNGEPCTEIPC